MSPQYGELRPTSGWHQFGSLGHPYKFQRVSRLGSITAWYSSSERQPNFAVLNWGRHLYSAGRPSRWALAHILVKFVCRRFIYLFFYALYLGTRIGLMMQEEWDHLWLNKCSEWFPLLMLPGIQLHKHFALVIARDQGQTAYPGLDGELLLNWSIAMCELKSCLKCV